MLERSFFFISNKLEFAWGGDLVRWFIWVEVVFPYFFLLQTPLFMVKVVEGFLYSIRYKRSIHNLIFCTI